MSTFLGELKRRNVFRVGIAYVVLGWLVIQITDTVAPALRLPDWTLSLVTWLGVIGFPFALLFAWAFELTPEGIKRSDEVAPEDSVTGQTASRLNQITLLLMAGVIALLLLDKFYLQGSGGDSESVSAETPAEPPPAEILDSIAVLPFVNMSDNPENQYFGDGLAEELLNQLASIQGLRVAARTSSFYFRDKDPTIAEVAEALDVVTVLEGSVQRSGDTIRVVAQLIRASDSAHLWSAKYDRPLDDYFQVQDDIANHIIGALMPQLGDGTAVAATAAANISPDLFQQFVAARQVFYDQTPEAFTRAHQSFLTITEGAPGYAPGWAWLARSWLAVSEKYGGKVSEDVARNEAEAAIERSLALDPEEARAYLARGFLFRDIDIQAEEAALRRALQLDPLLVDARLLLQLVLAFSGRTEEAVVMLEDARHIDPLHPGLLWNLAHLQNLAGNKRAAFATLEKLYIVNPVRAANLEPHLYMDSMDFARAINFRERYLKRHPAMADDPREHNSDAVDYLLLGIYDHPRITGTVWESLAAALRGDEGVARAMLGQVGPADEWSDFELLSNSRTLLVLQDLAQSRDALWSRWIGSARRSFDTLDFHALHGVTLAYVLSRTGEEAEFIEVATALDKAIGDMSPLHQGTLAVMQAPNHLFNNREELALDVLSQLADKGYAGNRMLGGPEPMFVALSNSPRLPAILQRLDANREAALVQLENLRNSPLTLEQLRQEYVAQLPVDN